jgi:hypothetical protein
MACSLFYCLVPDQEGAAMDVENPVLIVSVSHDGRWFVSESDGMECGCHKA